MTRKSKSLARAALGGLAVCAAGLALVGSAPCQSLPPKREASVRQEWLKAEHAKVVKDSQRIVVLARNLRHEAAQHEKNPLPPAILERTRELEAKAKELQEAAEAADENTLSLRVVTLAGEIRDTARSLRETFEKGPSRKTLETCRRFSREIESRAKAIHKRVSEP